MQVLQQAILRARDWGWQGDVPAEQLADLMDAVHNLPSLLQRWEDCDEEFLIQLLGDYEHKWAKFYGPSLRAIYEQTLSQDGNANHDPNDK